jgi:hypothetical protein
MSQKIHRAPRRHQWLVIDKRTVEDVRLTWAARGLLAYLLSRPDDWEVLVKDLIKRGNLKRDGIYTLLRELRAVGYVRYDPTRDAQWSPPRRHLRRFGTTTSGFAGYGFAGYGASGHGKAGRFTYYRTKPSKQQLQTTDYNLPRAMKQALEERGCPTGSMMNCDAKRFGCSRRWCRPTHSGWRMSGSVHGRPTRSRAHRSVFWPRWSNAARTGRWKPATGARGPIDGANRRQTGSSLVPYRRLSLIVAPLCVKTARTGRHSGTCVRGPRRSVPIRRKFGTVSVLVCVSGTDLCHNRARAVSERYEVPSPCDEGAGSAPGRTLQFLKRRTQ